MKFSLKDIFLIFVLLLVFTPAQLSTKKGGLAEIRDAKELKKLLRTKTNVLVYFSNNVRESNHVTNTLKEVAGTVKGLGTIIFIDCTGEAKKLCKKFKVSSSETFVLKHYKDGEFHKDYDRKLSVASLVNFMRDPTGDLPWEEDDSATDVVHLPNINSLNKLLKSERKPILVMFYAPWCGFCKQLKPEYAKAAAEVKGKHILAAIDVNRPENNVIRRKFNITGFPTTLYFENAQLKFVYEGGNKKENIIDFLKNPGEAPKKAVEPEWADSKSDVVHLKTGTFDDFIKSEESVLVMFYAPWCGHCKKMKPDFEQAAAELKSKKIKGVLAAVDATKETEVASRFDIKGFPTLKYFKNGSALFDAGHAREASKIVAFMENPTEPPPPPPPEKPWSEEPSEVIHLDKSNFKDVLKKKKHAVVAFYAPWCGYCKKMKPDFMAAAEEFKEDSRSVFAAVDCTENNELCQQYDVKGYPTFMYFHYFSKNTKKYSSGTSKEQFISFMRNLEPSEKKVTDSDKASENFETRVGSSKNIVKLSDQNFTSMISTHPNMIALFYTPVCRECEAMQKVFLQVAENIDSKPVTLVAVDTTTSPQLAKKFVGTEELPSLKYIKNGKFIANYSGKQSTSEINEFIKSQISTHLPKEEL